MGRADSYVDLVAMGAPVITSSQAAARMKCGTKAAYKRLLAMQKSGLISRVKPGLWLLDPGFPPFALAPFLTAPMPAYVSLASALAHHGVIEQIPRQISVVSLDRPRRISTSFGLYDVHRISPELFGGFEGEAEIGFVATPEKAIFDSVYIRAAAGTTAHFPELDTGPDFNRKRVEEWTAQINSARLRTLVTTRLNELLN